MISTKEQQRRLKISEAQKRAHSEGRHPGWAHKNQDSSRSSYPERWFRKILAEDSRFTDILVIEQHRVWKYYLDFAFAEFMVDLEIDGSQHRNPEQSRKDYERDTYLNSVGWHVYRIEWSQLFSNTQQCLDDFKKFLFSRTKELKVFVEAERKPVKISGEEKRKSIANQRMALINDANIDFSKFGWVQKVSEVIRIKPQKVNGWMKRYFPEILDQAFQRRTSNLSSK